MRKTRKRFKKMIKTVEKKIREKENIKKEKDSRRRRRRWGGGGMISREGDPACLRSCSVTSH